MSVEAMTWAMQQEFVADSSARHVLLILANNAWADGSNAFPAVATICKYTGLSERTVRSKLKELVECGAIEAMDNGVARAHIKRDDKIPVCYRLLLKRGANFAPREADGVQMTQERGANDAGAGCKSRTQTQQEPNPEPKDPSSGLLPAEVVFEHWKLKLDHPRSVLDAKRRRLIDSRLKDYPLSSLLDAITGCSLSPFHMGLNDRRQRYDDIELILRDAKHIEQFLAIKAAPPEAPAPKFDPVAHINRNRKPAHDAARENQGDCIVGHAVRMD